MQEKYDKYKIERVKEKRVQIWNGLAIYIYIYIKEYHNHAQFH